MDVYKKMWIERKKELLDKISKAPNPNAAARDIEELTGMIRQEVFASTKTVSLKLERIDGLGAVYIAYGNIDCLTDREDSSKELKKAAMPIMEYLNKHFDLHATAIIKEGRVTIVRDEISVPLPIRD